MHRRGSSRAHTMLELDPASNPAASLALATNVGTSYVPLPLGPAPGYLLRTTGSWLHGDSMMCGGLALRLPQRLNRLGGLHRRGLYRRLYQDRGRLDMQVMHGLRRHRGSGLRVHGGRPRLDVHSGLRLHWGGPRLHGGSGLRLRLRAGGR